MFLKISSSFSSSYNNWSCVHLKIFCRKLWSDETSVFVFQLVVTVSQSGQILIGMLKRIVADVGQATTEWKAGWGRVGQETSLSAPVVQSAAMLLLLLLLASTETESWKSGQNWVVGGWLSCQLLQIGFNPVRRRLWSVAETVQGGWIC